MKKLDVLQIVMPVLVMIILGMLCRKWKILTGEGVANMKVLVTNVMLPVAIFHALATAEYNKETGILILIMLIMLIVSFSLGFVLKPFLKGKYQRYLPFMVSVYEGGLMAYPLYTSLCGSENLSHVAVLDIAGLLFGFSIYMGMLGQVEDGGKIDVKKLFSSAIRTPAFIASVLGIIAGLSKIIIILLDSPFGGVYQSVENILTTSVTAIILLVVGYSMELNANLLKPCITTILIRMILQGVMMAGVLFAVHSLVGDSQIVNLAIITYMSSPATFSMQTFMKDEEGSAYVSTTNSMYCLVSILVYIILAVTIC
nr:AEC family transporter [uncultured Blautia sp.]